MHGMICLSAWDSRCCSLLFEKVESENTISSIKTNIKDQTGIHIVRSSCWMIDKGVKRVEVTGVSEKQEITVVNWGLSATPDHI